MNLFATRAPVRQLFGIGVHAVTMDETLAICRHAIEAHDHLNIGVVNAAKVIAMRRDRQLHDAVAGSDLVLADGMAVVWASKILRRPLPARVAGIDLFERLLGLANECGYGVYFLGATQEVLDEVLRRVRRDYPRLHVAGSRNGYFRDEEAAGVAETIRRSGADLLFVAMTSPKKELFLGRCGRHLDVAVCHGVGGSFDVLAGKVHRAPRGWQAVGLEWLYRVIQEPRRMWKRYLVTNAQFASLLWQEAMGARPVKVDASLPAARTRRGSRAIRTAHANQAESCKHSGSLTRLVESDGGWRVRLLPGLVDCVSRFLGRDKVRPRTDRRDAPVADRPARYVPPYPQASQMAEAPDESIRQSSGQPVHCGDSISTL